MKDAYGGIVNLVFIIIFLVIVIGVLGLTVSYTKAFKMKDRVISVIEEYEGSGCEIDGSACMNKIEKEAKAIAYSPPSLNCHGMNVGNDLFCYSVQKFDGNKKAIFTVVTQVDISFPIIDKIMGFRFFQVSGDTKTIELQVS